jgi:serine/threonine protein kinase
MRFIHSKGYIHRDLKPANILLDERGYPQIADMSSSHFYDLSLTLTSEIRTVGYMAPEMLNDEDYSHAVDVWSFALILYELLVGQPVFPSSAPLGVVMTQIQSGDRPQLPPTMNPTVSAIISRNWGTNPSERDLFDVIYDNLYRIDFKITPGVNFAAISEFLMFAGLEAPASPPVDAAVEVFQGAQPPDSPSQISALVEPSDSVSEVSAAVASSDAAVQAGADVAPSGTAPAVKGTAGDRPAAAGNFIRTKRLIECTYPNRTKMKGMFQKKPTSKPAIKKQKLRYPWGSKTEEDWEVPVGIIAYLTKQCGGNVSERKVVIVTSSPPAYNGDVAKNIADLDVDSYFISDCHDIHDEIPPTRNNWVCYDFKERRIIPTHYAVRTWPGEPGCAHMRSWLVEISGDGHTWQLAGSVSDSDALNQRYGSAVFPLDAAVPCRSIRLVNVGKNHEGTDQLWISSWEIFGVLHE